MGSPRVSRRRVEPAADEAPHVETELIESAPEPEPAAPEAPKPAESPVGAMSLQSLAAEYGCTPEEMIERLNAAMQAQGRDEYRQADGPEWQGEAPGDEDLDARDHPPVHTTHEAHEQSSSPVHTEWGQPWRPPATLDAPPPRPGMRQRWIAVSLRGQDQPANVSRKFREGWRPRPADTVPAEYQTAPTIQHGQFAGFIGVEGMLLCEMPIERVEARKRYYRNQVDRQMERIQHDLRKVEDRRMPLHQSVRSTFSRRPPVEPAPDKG